MSESPPLSPLFASLSSELLGALKAPWTPKRQFFDVRIMPYKPNETPSPRAWLAYLSSRNVRRYLIVLLVLASVSFLWVRGKVIEPVLTLKEKMTAPALPPLYETWYEFESRLPSQDPSLPYPEGADARFFYAANHVWGLGFNNALQEQMFLAHLAYISNRTFVFDAYTWVRERDQPYSEFNGKLIPSRIPLTAIISGPNVGGSWPDGIKAPRAVSRPYYESMCPSPTKVKSDAMQDRLGIAGTTPVTDIMELWSARLKQSPSKCIEMNDSDQLFNWMIFGSGSVLMPFLDDFLKSPILKGFGWSTLISDALSVNIHLITGSGSKGWLSWLSGPSAEAKALLADSNSIIPGLLSIHIRRGDFDEHCRGRAKWGSTYMGWLMNPNLPDHFEVPPQSEYVQTDELTKQYMSHCWPTPEEIIAKIAEVRRTDEGRDLNRVYIMTNGPIEWVADLKAKIAKLGGWKSVSSSRDLALNAEQKHIAQAVDMAVAIRSQVFIGNGFSSLSANTVILRLSRGLSYMANRLW